MSNYNDSGWEPVTRLGRKVQEGEIEDMETALNSGLPPKEPEIIDQLLPGLEDEVLDINMVQRMTDSGRRVKFPLRRRGRRPQRVRRLRRGSRRPGRLLPSRRRSVSRS